LIDLHAHLLPGMDDGVQNTREAINTARQAFHQGITHIVATPHVIPNIYQHEPAVILDRVNALQQTLHEQKVPVKILPGAEYYLEPELPLKLARGELLTLNGCGKHLLVELPHLYLPDYAEHTLFELQLKGVTPVLAHPERNSTLGQHPERLRNLVKRGILVQITAGSLTGLYGKGVRAVAELLVREELVHFVATDLHGAGRRLSVIQDARKRLRRLMGEERAHQILLHNPVQVLGAGNITGPRQQMRGELFVQG
jgi:protein-tyrosine phosphatase